MARLPVLSLGPLGLDRGGHLLLKRALRGASAGDELEVAGEDPNLAIHLRTWAREQGHRVEEGRLVLGRVRRGQFPAGDPQAPDGRAEPLWGLAARGSTVEDTGPTPRFALDRREDIWTDDAARLYRAAAAAQWDPEAVIPWNADFELPDEVEDALVQVFTYLVENEEAALVVPARFLGQIHPHFREIQQVLAVQVADEARHVEVFTRRALLRRPRLGFSSAGGRTSLQTLLDEPDFALASFLLSVLGEGSFLHLLRFVGEHAPDPITAAIMRHVVPDEARHVAFAMAHLRQHLARDNGLLPRLSAAVDRRHAALQYTSGLNAEVFDALVLLAAGSWEPQALMRGWDAVMALQADMDAGRQVRLRALGFPEAEATRLASLHTRNFM